MILEPPLASAHLGLKMGAQGSPTSSSPDNDIGEIKPAFYHDDGGIPVFKPTMEQFRDFRKFIEKIDHYGMQSGIIKIIPPSEWRATLPDISEKASNVKVHKPIVQEFEGTMGIYKQMNVERKRSYTLAEWKSIACSRTNQTPAARRKRSEPNVGGGGSSRAERAAGRASRTNETLDAPTRRSRRGLEIESPSKDTTDDQKPTPDQSDSTFALAGVDDFTDERCKELEDAYWRSVTYGTTMYGADMLGSLFDDSTTCWNVAHLENVLDVLGTRVPGVNTAYLYVGMWKATFAWHLEDVDLYSINYIHFGAPKQWYSISQGDVARFEKATREIWPEAHRECDQFLRHKTFLVSPAKLKKDYNIEVNRLIQREGEFVVTFPYGYHAGYNLGYNCAESVNFATRGWIERGVGRRAHKCECEGDSVWVNVREIEERLGVHVPGFTDDDESDLSDDGTDEDDGPQHTPISVRVGRPRGRPPGRRGGRIAGGTPAALRKRTRKSKRCALCPTTDPVFDYMPVFGGRRVHKVCATTLALFISDPTPDTDNLPNTSTIPDGVRGLTCSFCRSRRGAVIQCGGCTKVFHPTCVVLSGGACVVQRERLVEDGEEWGVKHPRVFCWNHRSLAQSKGSSIITNPAQGNWTANIIPGQVVHIKTDKTLVWAAEVLEHRPESETVVVRPLQLRRRAKREVRAKKEELVKTDSDVTEAPIAVVGNFNATCDTKDTAEGLTPVNQQSQSAGDPEIKNEKPRPEDQEGDSPPEESPVIEISWTQLVKPAQLDINPDSAIEALPHPPAHVKAKYANSVAASMEGQKNVPATGNGSDSANTPGDSVTVGAGVSVPVSGTPFLTTDEVAESNKLEGSDLVMGLVWGELNVSAIPRPADQACSKSSTFWHYLHGDSTDTRDEYSQTPGGAPDSAARPKRVNEKAERISSPATFNNRFSIKPPTTQKVVPGEAHMNTLFSRVNALQHGAPSQWNASQAYAQVHLQAQTRTQDLIQGRPLPPTRFVQQQPPPVMDQLPAQRQAQQLSSIDRGVPSATETGGLPSIPLPQYQQHHRLTQPSTFAPPQQYLAPHSATIQPEQVRQPMYRPHITQKSGLPSIHHSNISHQQVPPSQPMQLIQPPPHSVLQTYYPPPSYWLHPLPAYPNNNNPPLQPPRSANAYQSTYPPHTTQTYSHPHPPSGPSVLPSHPIPSITPVLVPMIERPQQSLPLSAPPLESSSLSSIHNQPSYSEQLSNRYGSQPNSDSNTPIQTSPPELPANQLPLEVQQYQHQPPNSRQNYQSFKQDPNGFHQVHPVADANGNSDMTLPHIHPYSPSQSRNGLGELPGRNPDQNCDPQSSITVVGSNPLSKVDPAGPPVQFSSSLPTPTLLS